MSKPEEVTMRELRIEIANTVLGEDCQNDEQSLELADRILILFQQQLEERDKELIEKIIGEWNKLIDNLEMTPGDGIKMIDFKFFLETLGGRK